MNRLSVAVPFCLLLLAMSCAPYHITTQKTETASSQPGASDCQIEEVADSCQELEPDQQREQLATITISEVSSAEVTSRMKDDVRAQACDVGASDVCLATIIEADEAIGDSPLISFEAFR